MKTFNICLLAFMAVVVYFANFNHALPLNRVVTEYDEDNDSSNSSNEDSNGGNIVQHRNQAASTDLPSLAASNKRKRFLIEMLQRRLLRTGSLRTYYKLKRIAKAIGKF